MTGGHRRILVVEDDPETAGQIVDSLTTSGYQVDLAASGNEALSRGVASDYAVITIDRMLPDIDGIAVMRQLRDDGIAAPVLIISALGEVDDRVRGLRAGGDDYLVKPFAMAELVARIHAVLRRSRPGGSSISVADLVINDDATLVRRGDDSLDLTDTERRLLGYLAAHRDRVVSKTQILTAVWGYDGFDDNVVEVHISNPEAREAFRHVSVLAAACIAKVAGFGPDSYRTALEALLRRLKRG